MAEGREASPRVFLRFCNVCGKRQAYHPDLEAAAVRPKVQGACRSCGQFDWRPDD